jgi:sodium transport system ATP-binding protein
MSDPEVTASSSPSSSSRAGVVIEDLTKLFGRTAAVSGLSLTVTAGEIYGLLGPNGAGKTTTLRVLAGILNPSSGRATVDGIEVGTRAHEAKRRVGFLTGTTGLYARLTVRELLVYFGRLHGMSAERVGERIALLARVLDFEGLLAKRCEALSSGQKQRVSVARAVLHDPPVLILDEPTVGLDVLASRFLRDFVRGERERGKAVLFSTHYLAEAELLCDRIGLLYRGRMLREGSPAALRAASGMASLEEAFLSLVAALESPNRADRTDET